MNTVKAALAPALAAAVACSAEVDRDFTTGEPFERIHVSGPATLEIRQGEPTHVKVAGADSVLAEVEIDVSDGTLFIDVGDEDLDVDAVRVDITTANLSEIYSDDAIRVTATDLTAGDLVVEDRGRGDYRLSGLTARELTVDARGALNFVVDGTAERQSVDVAGAGNYDAGALKTEVADLRLRGAASGNVWVTDRLDVNIAGAGSVTYRGDAVVSKRILGAGSVSRIQ